MGKIDELIKQLCPDGVQETLLGEIMTIGRGASPRPIKNYMSDKINGIPWIKIGDVTPNDKYIRNTAEYVTKEGAKKSRFLHKGDFILSNSMSFGRPYILGIDGCIHDGWIAMSGFGKDVCSKYLYYILRCDTTQKYWRMHANNGGAMTNLNADIVRGTSIPLPPLAVQEKIVEILDTFTGMIDNLQKELEQRQKQFEHYCESLVGSSKGEVKALGEIGKMERGTGLQKSDFREAGVPCIHYGQIHTYYGTVATETKSFCSEELAKKLRKAKPGDLLIATTSEDVEACCKATVWLGDGEVVYSGDSFKFSHNQNPKYIAYLFKTEAFSKQKRLCATGAKVVRVSGSAMEKFKFSFPSLEKQQEIVDKLDTFEALISNIKQEIELRQKQYEYYREKLLTFE